MKYTKIVLNIVIIGIVFAIIILGYSIFSKYYQNHLNEEDIMDFVSINYLQNTNSMVTNKSEDTLNFEKTITTYKGYNVVGVISIDKIGISYPILDVPVNKDEALEVSVIKFSGGTLNENGNVTLAGHNYYDSTMFAKLHKLKVGDIATIIDNTKRVIDYEVYSIYSTSPMDTKCLETIDTNKKELTLITCTKGNLERLVVKLREIN